MWGEPLLSAEVLAFLESIPGKGKRGSIPKQPAYEVALIRGRTVVAIMGIVVDVSSTRAFRDTYKLLLVFEEDVEQVLHDEYGVRTRQEAVYDLASVG
ncbi:MAG: hypothetical protein ABI690_25590 [Chloroflexota bacterium]